MLHSSRMDMGIRTIVNAQSPCTSTTEGLRCSLNGIQVSRHVRALVMLGHLSPSTLAVW